MFRVKAWRGWHYCKFWAPSRTEDSRFLWTWVYFGINPTLIEPLNEFNIFRVDLEPDLEAEEWFLTAG